MRNFLVLTEALAYIEAHLEEPLSQEEIAQACHVSLSGLQKLFRYALHIGIKEYIARRRLTLSARDLLDTAGKVVDIAYKYQYQSPEVFARAFQRLWGETPTQFRREWTFSGLFPKVEGFIQGGDGMTRKKVDISELYEVLRGMRDTVVLCFDIRGLMPINDISSEAGDLAIVESLRRIDGAAEDGMLLFRIGGDEFALVTGYTDRDAALAVGRKVLEKNGDVFLYNGREIPLSLHMADIRIQGGNLRYAELFDTLQRRVNETK